MAKMPVSIDPPILRHAGDYAGRGAKPIPAVLDHDRVVKQIVRCAQNPLLATSWRSRTPSPKEWVARHDPARVDTSDLGTARCGGLVRCCRPAGEPPVHRSARRSRLTGRLARESARDRESAARRGVRGGPRFHVSPVLVFAAAPGLSTRAFFRDLVPILVLAIPALAVSAMLVGLTLRLGLGTPFAAALLFGVLISATLQGQSWPA